jgi:hypothetical protein
MFMREGRAALVDATLRSGVLIGSLFAFEFIYWSAKRSRTRLQRSSQPVVSP